MWWLWKLIVLGWDGDHDWRLGFSRISIASTSWKSLPTTFSMLLGVTVER
jgi:hypothetical protein